MCSIKNISDTLCLTEEEVKNIIEDFKKNFDKNITVQSVTDAVVSAMKVVGKIKKLNGKDKKYLVSSILLYIVDETNIGEMDLILDNVLKNIIPVMIDTLISVENGKLKFNNKSCLRNFLCINF